MDYDSDDDYICDLESDQEEAIDSSPDELEIVLHGTPEQRRKLDKHLAISSRSRTDNGTKNEKGDSSDDDFEKEMAAELSATMSALEKNHKSGLSLPSTSQEASQEEGTPQFYDDMYFDSDSDDEGKKQAKLKRKHPIPSNDDLLYDPDADDADQSWVDRQRQIYQVPAVIPPGSTNAPKTKLPKSDAILNCPACMVQLCLDCQRHEKFQSQYRAMFVMNCSVDFSQRLKFPKHQQQKNKSKKRKRKDETQGEEEAEQTLAAGGAPGESYHPVKCEQCNTEVAVYDQEEVFHFFNVLASHS